VISSRDLDGRPADHFDWMKAPKPLAIRMVDWLAAQDAAGTRRGA
jgi:hypothetical protein